MTIHRNAKGDAVATVENASSKAENEPSGSKKSFCYEDLKRRILTVELEAGSFIDETRISEAYGISRSPLREILRQLAGEGFVVLQENRGATVTPMTLKTFRNFFVVAPMIYSAVAQLAARNAKPAQIERLKEAQRRFRNAIGAGDIAERSLSNERFHMIMGEMADNEFLMPSLTRLLIDHTRLGMTFFTPDDNGADKQRILAAADQHDEFIALIAEREADKAAALTIAHWELSRGDMGRFAVPASLDVKLDPSRFVDSGEIVK